MMAMGKENPMYNCSGHIAWINPSTYFGGTVVATFGNKLKSDDCSNRHRIQIDTLPVMDNISESQC